MANRPPPAETQPTEPTPQGPLKFYEKMLNSLLCASNDPNAPSKSCRKKCIDCLKPTQEEEGTTEQPSRDTWGNRCTFFVSTLGMSVGLGQVWRFPTLAYENGGGAFLLIYGLMIFLFGNSIFFFEIINGQYTSKNPTTVYDKVPLFQGIGWAMVAYAYLFCTYYSHMVSFSLYYFFSSFTSELPWSVCPSNQDEFPDEYRCMPYPKFRNPLFDGIVCGNEGFMYDRVELCSNATYADEQKSICCNLTSTTDPSACDSIFNIIDLCRPREIPTEYFWNHVVNRQYRKSDPMYGYIGPTNLWLVGTSFLSWFIAYITLYKGIKSLGLLMYVMVTLPYIVLIVMFGVVIPQEGAANGLKNFFLPKISSLYDIHVWRVATEQAFYSIGVGMGPLITFGSYSRFNNPSHIDGTLICLCIFLTSILCSLVVFSVLGFLSLKSGKPFFEVISGGPGLVYIVYPESLEMLPAPYFFSVLFYLMLINLGLSSVTGIIETVPSAIYDIWPKTRKFKYLVTLGVFTSTFLLGLPITSRGGLHVYNAYDVYSAGIPLLPLCALEVFTVIYIYGLGRFCEDIAFMLGFYPNRYYRYQWMLGPFVLLIVFIYGLATLKVGDQRPWEQALGWILFLFVMSTVPAGMIYNIIVFKKANNLKNILKPKDDHGPKNEEDRAARQEFSTKRKIF